MTRTELDKQMKDLLNRFELLMQGSTQAWNPAGSGGSRDYGCPPGSWARLSEEWVDRYNRADTDTERRDVIHYATKALERITRKPEVTVVGEPPAERDARLGKLQGQGWTAAEVALSERCTPTDVRQSWARHKARQDHGGGSVRQVAASTGLSRSKVHRMFGNRAA